MTNLYYGKSFCVLILAHGRPDRVHTIDTLLKIGYTGPWYLVVDNEDKTREEYVARFGEEHVRVFDKLEYFRRTDTADLTQERRVAVFARNACFDIAREMGYEYFVELDDDYTGFYYRYEEGEVLRAVQCYDVDKLFVAMIRWLEESDVAAVAIAQGGDFIGGRGGAWTSGRLKRKCMNSWFCRSADEWRFVGRMNDDVNTYVVQSHRGKVFFTTLYAMIVQPQTTAAPGGMTDVYKLSGTYVKSFYTVMMVPSAVRVDMIYSKFPRIHHRVNWNNCAPKIVPESYRRVE